MKLYLIDRVEERNPEDFGKTSEYRAFSYDVEVAETVDLRVSRFGIYPKVTLVRVRNKGETIEMAFGLFAGITEDEKDIAVHMYNMESYEDVGQTVRLHKADNSVVAEKYYSIPFLKNLSREEKQRMMYEDWELQYGCRRFEKRSRKKGDKR